MVKAMQVNVWPLASLTPGLPLPSHEGDCHMYLAGIKMPDDLDDDLVILIRGLVSWHYHLGCCQILQLVHLGGVGGREKLKVLSRKHGGGWREGQEACH